MILLKGLDVWEIEDTFGAEDCRFRGGYPTHRQFQINVMLFSFNLLICALAMSN